jgi:hypothetical protein
METERHILRLELMQAESKRKEELCLLEREALLAKKAYYENLIRQNKGSSGVKAENLAKQLQNGSAEDSV